MKKEKSEKDNSNKPQKKLTTSKEMKAKLTSDFLSNLNSKAKEQNKKD